MSETITVAGALDDARRRLRAAGIEDAGREARLLLGHAAGLDAAAIIGHPERHLAPEAMRAMADAVTDRAQRRPMAQVTGSREFWSLPFRVTPVTLDPRPDSETVVGAVLDRVGDRGAGGPTLRVQRRRIPAVEPRGHGLTHARVQRRRRVCIEVHAFHADILTPARCTSY